MHMQIYIQNVKDTPTLLTYVKQELCTCSDSSIIIIIIIIVIIILTMVLFGSLDTPLDPVFRRYFHHFWSDFKNKFAVEFSKFSKAGYNGRNEFLKPEKFSGFGFPHLGFNYLVG